MNYAVILAGGVGSRFWPISTLNTPKQILNITEKFTPLQNTIKRIGDLIDRKNIIVITNKLLEKEVVNQVKQFKIPKANILTEPYRKNTALPIGWAAFKLYKSDPESLMIVLPSDHSIKEKANFYISLKKAIKFAQSDYLVTLGIKPSSPDTAYGYIKIKSKLKSKKLKISSYSVEKFCEKPNLQKAKEFIKDKSCYWNSGIFIWKTKTILEEFKKYMPKTYLGIANSQNKAKLKIFWKKQPNISIDYGILEKSRNVLLVPANFDWIDIGSWDALDKVLKKDINGNIIHGKSLNLESCNLTIWSDDRMKNKKLIATIGIKDTIIVESENAILICHKDKAQGVKKISKLLNKK